MVDRCNAKPAAGVFINARVAHDPPVVTMMVTLACQLERGHEGNHQVTLDWPDPAPVP